jgi:TonB family protein
MVGFVSSVSLSQMEMTLLEHVTFTVHIGPSTQVTEDGRPASLSKIRIPSAVRVHGTFDMQAHTVEAEAIELLPAKELRFFEFSSGNFLKTWTAGTVTAVQPDNVIIERLDGEVETIQLGPDTSYVARAEPVSFARLQKGQRVRVRFDANHPSLARSILIQGMLPQTLNGQEAEPRQEPTQAKVEADQVSKPTCQYCPNPEFPYEAKKAGITSARAVLEITVSEEGKVDPHDIRVIDDPGDGFTKAAVAIVKKWKFKPAVDKDGKPVKTTTSVEIAWHRW